VPPSSSECQHEGQGQFGSFSDLGFPGTAIVRAGSAHLEKLPEK